MSCTFPHCHHQQLFQPFVSHKDILTQSSHLGIVQSPQRASPNLNGRNGRSLPQLQRKRDFPLAVTLVHISPDRYDADRCRERLSAKARTSACWPFVISLTSSPLARARRARTLVLHATRPHNLLCRKGS